MRAGDASRAPPGSRSAPEDFLDLLAPAVQAWEERLRAEGFAPLRAAWLARATRLGEDDHRAAAGPDADRAVRDGRRDRRAGARHRRAAGWCCRRPRSASRERPACCSPLTSATPTRSSRCMTASGCVAEWRCRTERQRTADEYFVWLRQLMDFGRIEARDPTRWWSPRWCRRCCSTSGCWPTAISTPAPMVVGKPDVKLGPAAGRSRDAGRRRPAGQHRRRASTATAAI